MNQAPRSVLFLWHNDLWLGKTWPTRLITKPTLWLFIGFALLFCTTTTTQAATLRQVPSVQPRQTNESGVTLQYHADVTTTTPGGLINYTMTVTNHDVVTATEVIAISMLSTHTTYLSGTVIMIDITKQITQVLAPSGIYDLHYHGIAWGGNMAPQSAMIFRFTLTVKEEVACRKTIRSETTLDLENAPLVLGEHVIGVICDDRPDLQLTHTSNITSATFHDTIRYQVQIRNHGLVAATDLVLFDTLPAPDNLTYLPETLAVSSGQALYDAAKHQIRWVGNVPAQGIVSITFAVKLTTFTSCKTLYSHAVLQSPSIQELSAVAEVEYRCPLGGTLEFAMQAAVTQTMLGGMIDYQLTITYTGELPITELKVINPIPFGTAYVTGTATASSPTIDTITFDRQFKQLSWHGTLDEKSSVTLHFTLQVRDRLPCGNAIINRATLFEDSFITPSQSIIETITQVRCSENPRWTDFGDAPDSDSNHHGMNNTAYGETGVLGHFPTVWEGTPPNEPSGPTHITDHFWLGDKVGVEADADLSLTSYAHTNILDNGQEDTADWELWYEDDGWLNSNQIALLNCEESLLVIRVSRADLPTDIDRLWLNVWFDGNHDGDWNDVGNCFDNTTHQPVNSFEWIVQDRAIDAKQIPFGGYLDLMIPTTLIYNTVSTMDAWMRFTLSEQQAVHPPEGGLADGRGLAHPDVFRTGETEDNLYEFTQGEPRQIILEPWIAWGVTETVKIGKKIHMGIYFGQVGGMTPLTFTMSNALPTEVVMIDQPKVKLEFGTPITQVITFNPALGASGTVEWSGRLLPHTIISVSYDVQVNECPPPNEDGEPTLRSMAHLRQPDGTLTSVEATYAIDCEQPKLFLPLINR